MPHIRTSIKYFSSFLFLICLLFTPFFASAKTTPTATLDTSSLISNISKPSISGTATGTKTIKIAIYKEDSEKVFYKKTVTVKKGVWKTKISKKLPEGDYEINILEGKSSHPKILASGTITIDTSKKGNTKLVDTTLVVSPVPLLAGGVARAGKSVPIAYLQVNNTGKEDSALKGFWLTQNGSADTKSIIGFTVTDDKGVLQGSVAPIEGSILFKDGKTFVATPNTILTPGQLRLFTIKAILSQNISSHIGKNLMIDIASIDTNASTKAQFPIRGTTWAISN